MKKLKDLSVAERPREKLQAAPAGGTGAMENANDSTVTTSPEYRRFIEDLKARVISARICAARAVNRDLILLYWDIGHGIVEKQKTLGWGDAVVEMVAADLRRAFPASQSFSPDNLWRMRQFYLAYSTSEFLGQAVPEKKRATSADVKPAILGQPVPETGPTIAFHGQSPIFESAGRRSLGAESPDTQENHRPSRPPILPPSHRPIRLVAQRPAEPNQGRGLRARGHGKERPTTSRWPCPST